MIDSTPHITNQASKYSQVSLDLDNGARLTGIVFVPQASASRKTVKGTPIIIGIHGGTCCAHIYDADPTCTASTPAEAAGVPFIAINRPNYLTSSGWIVGRRAVEPLGPGSTVKEGNTYLEEEARWYHKYIFPALVGKVRRAEWLQDYRNDVP